MTASTISIANNGGNYYIYGTSSGTATSISTCTTTTSGTYISGGGGIVVSAYTDPTITPGEFQVPPGSTLMLPDGHIIVVDDNGNFEILDDNAKVTYKANNVLEFNKYINASDLLEAFIKDLGKMGVKQGEVLNVPIDLFINWLILKAAEQDGDDVPNDVPKLESSVKPTKHPKCLCCGKFIKKALVEHKIHFCSPLHHEKYLKRIGI